LPPFATSVTWEAETGAAMEIAEPAVTLKPPAPAIAALIVAVW
jgi:hypothetical protein